MSKVESVELAERFLRELSRGLPDDERVMAGYAKEATVQTDETGKKKNAGWWPVPWREGKWINPNANCYVCISSSIKTPNQRGEMRYWRGEASFGHGLALMIDDIGTGKGSKGKLTLESLVKVLPPTAIVETSPKNFQVWYFLDEPEPSLQKFKAFIRGFVAKVLKDGGDQTIKDVSRYGRMPCGVNNKRMAPDGPFKYAVEKSEPFGDVWQVKLNYFRPKNRYSIEKISRSFGYEVVIPVRKRLEIDKDNLDIDMYWLKLAVEICSEAKMGEGSGGEVAMNMSGKYRIRCPWGHEHSNGDPYGAYFRGPIPGADVDFVFGCGHDTCRRENKRTWNEFVDEIVMPKIIEDLEDANNNWSK